jgi:hypothetical protein
VQSDSLIQRRGVVVDYELVRRDPAEAIIGAGDANELVITEYKWAFGD